MRTVVKPTVTKRVDFTIPRGLISMGHPSYNYDTRKYEYPFESEADALKARSIVWDDSDNEEMVATVTHFKDKLLLLIGPSYDEMYTVLPGNAYFKLTPIIAKKLIKRALATEAGKQVRPNDAEKAEIKVTKRGPVFERVAGKGSLFLFTAPCGDTSVLKEKTLLSMIEAIELAEKELK